MVVRVAVFYTSTAALRILMSFGSDINTINLNEESPVLNSLLIRRDENTEWLLERGADYTVINTHG